MELAGSYIDLMMPEKPRTAYPVQGFTTEYSGPLHEDPEHSSERMKSMGNIKSAAVPRIQVHLILHHQEVKVLVLPM